MLVLIAPVPDHCLPVTFINSLVASTFGYILLKKVLHHQIFTKIYKYHFFLSIRNLNFKFDIALEDSIQYLTQQ